MTKPQLIGVGGTNAAGKDTFSRYLVDKYGYEFVSTSDIIRQEAMRRYGNILRPTLARVGNELRAEQGPGVMVLLCIDNHKKSGNKVGLVVSSIRTKGEVDEIKKQGGVIVFVDADQRVRYDRLKSRGRADDFINFEQFKAEEQAEWHQSDDPGEFSIRTVKESADYVFSNNSDETSFFAQIEHKFFSNKKVDIG